MDPRVEFFLRYLPIEPESRWRHLLPKLFDRYDEEKDFYRRMGPMKMKIFNREISITVAGRWSIRYGVGNFTFNRSLTERYGIWYENIGRNFLLYVRRPERIKIGSFRGSNSLILYHRDLYLEIDESIDLVDLSDLPIESVDQSCFVHA